MTDDADMRILESSRLLIKPVEEEDIDQLLEFRWERDTMAQSIHDPISQARQLAWFKSLTDKDLAFSVFAKDSQPPTLIGTAGLYDISTRHQRACFRVRLGRVARGKRLGLEAARMVIEYGFQTLNLHKVFIDQFPENEASVRFFTRLGGVREGLLREHYYQDGRFRDAAVVGVLKDEFLAAVRQMDAAPGD